MKRFLCLVTALLLLSVIPGCSKETQPLADITDYDSEAFFPVGDDSRPVENGDNSEHATQNGGFVVRDRKYTYEGHDLVILNVENQTEQNYSITINGAYLDENGKILQEEMQTFDGFEAGWKNYFLFQPDLTFDNFTYTLDVQEFTGECVASKLQFGWVQEISESIDPVAVSTGADGLPVWDDRKRLYVNVYSKVHGTMPMQFCFRGIVLDSKGEIFTMDALWVTATKQPEVEEQRMMILMDGFLPDEDIPIPESLQDGFTILLAIKDAKWDPTWAQE